MTAQTTKPVAGVYYQPVGNFALVQAQGVNALFGYDSGPNKTDTMDAWCASANKAGLRYFLQCFKTSTPGAGAPVLPLAIDPVAMAHQHDPSLIGYLLPDEPNGAGNLTAAQCQALYAACHSAAPGVPVVINLDGGHVLQFGQTGTGPYLAAADWISFDGYPLNYAGAGGVTIPALQTIAADLKSWAPGKPVMEIFECSNMLISIQAWCAGTPLAAAMRGPTGSEMQTEVASGRAGGIMGICWFPQVIGNGPQFAYWGCNADQAASMLAINAPTLTLQQQIDVLSAQVATLQKQMSAISAASTQPTGK